MARNPPPGRLRPGTALTYAATGVDIDAGDATVERIKGIAATTDRPGVTGGLGGFGAFFDLDTCRYRHPLLVSSTDGVGTKLDVARLAERYDTIGIDLVAMCVDDIACAGAEPLFFLDYIAVERLVPDQIEQIVSGIARGCTIARCALVGGETAEHPRLATSGHHSAEFDLAGFAVGAVERGDELGSHRVKGGDLLIGLTSRGLRSNGYSLARHVLFDRAAIALDDPAWDGASNTLADELLIPSIIYSPAIGELVLAIGASLHAVAHITGGGIPGNLSRILPPGLDAHVERGAWNTPRIFEEIARLGPVDDDEMLRVFNLGLGMVIAVDRLHVDDALDSLNLSAKRISGDFEVVVVGDITPGDRRVIVE